MGWAILIDRPLQNRELQIMRIVRHPNIVELKAFYYSNGDRVNVSWVPTGSIPSPPLTCYPRDHRKTKSTSTSSSNTCQRRSIAHHAISTN